MIPKMWHLLLLAVLLICPEKSFENENNSRAESNQLSNEIQNSSKTQNNSTENPRANWRRQKTGATNVQNNNLRNKSYNDSSNEQSESARTNDLYEQNKTRTRFGPNDSGLLVDNSSLRASSIHSDNYGELVAVVVIFRHGDTSPIQSFPTDKFFDEKYWPMGLGGQLTEPGNDRLYRLGQWLKVRYNDFLSQSYSAKELYAYAPDYNKCLMSVTAALSGLYPPKVNQAKNRVLWQPIPVHSQSLTTDNIFTEGRSCPKYKRMVEVNDEVKNSLSETKYKRFYQFLATNTGIKDLSLNDIGLIRDVLYTYENYNASFLPEWREKLDGKILDYITGIHLSTPTSNPALARLRIGPFYNYIFQLMDRLILQKEPVKNSNNTKFFIMSELDVTLSSILHAMDCYKTKPIGFGDAIIWELKKNFDEYFINLLYKEEDNFLQLDCCQNCNYQRFKKNLRSVTIPENKWLKECR